MRGRGRDEREGVRRKGEDGAGVRGRGFCPVSDAHHAHAEGIGVEVTAQSKSHPCGGKWEKCCTSVLTACL